jgi:4'-phosphopantetheinyl transferase
LQAADEVRLHVAALDDWAPPAVHACDFLSPEELAAADAFVFSKDRVRYIGARVFLRTVLAAYLGIGPDAVRFARGANGKPVLRDGSAAADIRFNLSHAKGCAVCAVVRGREVGVDVEQLRPLRDAALIAERVLSPGELEVYDALPPEAKHAALLRGWTRKEAYLKATGDGITRRMRDVEVVLDPALPAALLAVGGNRHEAIRWNMYETTPATGFVCTVVVDASYRASTLQRSPNPG